MLKLAFATGTNGKLVPENLFTDESKAGRTISFELFLTATGAFVIETERQKFDSRGELKTLATMGGYANLYGDRNYGQGTTGNSNVKFARPMCLGAP